MTCLETARIRHNSGSSASSRWIEARELRKAGIKIRLQPQPFEILVMLASRSGQVVSREELQQQLWSADTFVDFERSLNAGVKRLRIALSDDADTPRYIETIPRQGYRMISPIVQVFANAPTSVWKLVVFWFACPCASLRLEQGGSRRKRFSAKCLSRTSST